MIPETLYSAHFYSGHVHLNNDILDKILTGAKITGAETMNFPDTDGYILYLKYPDGSRAVLSFELNVDIDIDRDLEGEPLQMSFNFIQDEEQPDAAATIRETDISRTVGVKKCPKCHKNT